MKYKNKQHYLQATEASWHQLRQTFEALSQKQMTLRQPEGMGLIRWSPKDVLAHIYAWHRLFLGWYKTGMHGLPDLPAKDYNWRQTPALNQSLYQQLKSLPTSSVVLRLKRSHGRVHRLAQQLSEPQLFKPGHFAWTKKLGLISYLAGNTDGHYRWGQKKIESILKS